MRAPSPSSTIGTDYGEDATTSVDNELSERDFHRKCEEMIGISHLRPEEDEANRDPLIFPRPDPLLYSRASASRPKLSPLEEKRASQGLSLSRERCR